MPTRNVVKTYRSLTRVARGGRARGDRGAVLIEAAIVFPVLMLIIFGILEWGLAFMTATNTNSATRAGARAAVAYTRIGGAGGYVAGGTGYDNAAVSAVETAMSGALSSATPLELWVYRVDPTSTNGSPLGSSNFTVCATDCEKFTWNGSRFAYVSGTWLAQNQNACGSPSSPNWDSLGVYLKVQHNFVTNFFGQTKIIAERTIMRLEPQPLSTCSGS